MNIRNLKYFIIEGFKSFWINGLMSFASMTIVIACLLIFGVYILFSMNINYIVNQFKAQYEIQVFIDENAPLNTVKEIGASIRNLPNVDNAVFFSKQQALDDYKKQLGNEAPMLEGLENDNPLRDSYKVTFVELSLVDDTSNQIAQIANVAKILNDNEVTNKMVTASAIIKNISLWLMILLGIGSIFIISNAIKLTLFARRKDINIMKYLGATDWFIRWPFMIEGIIIGLIGSIISLCIVSQSYFYFIGNVGTFLGGTFLGGTLKTYGLYEIIWQLAGYFALIGVALGSIGSGISLRRYLRV